MKFKKVLGCVLVLAMILGNSIVSFANEQCPVLNPEDDVIMKTEYSIEQSSSENIWIWEKYSDAWKIEFVYNKGNSYCKVYPTKGSRDFFTVYCTIVTDGECHVPRD